MRENLTVRTGRGPDVPEGLWPGPDGTYFGQLGDVPGGWEYWQNAEAAPTTLTCPVPGPLPVIVQCRPGSDTGVAALGRVFAEMGVNRDLAGLTLNRLLDLGFHLVRVES